WLSKTHSGEDFRESICDTRTGSLFQLQSVERGPMVQKLTRDSGLRKIGNRSSRRACRANIAGILERAIWFHLLGGHQRCQSAWLSRLAEDASQEDLSRRG